MTDLSLSKTQERLMSRTTFGLAIFLPIPFYLLFSVDQGLSAHFSSAMACGIYYIIKKIIEILLFQKKSFFFIILYLLKFGTLILFFYIALYVLNLEVLGMVIGLSVLPLSIVISGLIIISKNKI